MTTTVQAWLRSAQVLGVEIEGPVDVMVRPAVKLQADMLVRGFGAPKGTLVFHEFHGSSVLDELQTEGYAASSFGPYDEGAECTPGDVVEVLADWGWAGDGDGPDWLITLDAANWRQPTDFYEALLPRLKAPSWHGQNLDALWDSLVGGQINGLDPPLAVQISNTLNFPAQLYEFMVEVETLFANAKEAGVPIFLDIWT